MNKENAEIFENSTKCWICDITFVEGGVEVRDYCHIKRDYRDTTHRDFYVNVSLNCKDLIVFYNLKYYDACLFMHEIWKFDFKINLGPNGSKKHMS